MFDFITSILQKVKGSDRRYLIQPYRFIRNDKIEQELLRYGYCVVDFIDQDQLSLLIELYRTEHNLLKENGGIFLSSFSKDVEYRQRIHNRVHDILLKSFNDYFIEYDDNINSFAIKTPGKKSHFVIHQDMAAIDETKHSLLNIWTPLDNIILDNGPLFVIPGSHRLFSPFRCPTAPSILENIQSELYAYAIPVYLKVGQAIFFDPRLIHYSTENSTNSPRVVVQSRIYPQNSDVVVYYNDSNDSNKRVGKYICPKDYFKYGNANNDNCKPQGGVFDRYEDYPSPISRSRLDDIILELNLTKNYPNTDPETEQEFIREPKS